MRLLALTGSVLAVLLAGCGGGEAPSSEPRATLDVRLSEFELAPPTVTLDDPGTYAFRVVNDGETVHALALEGGGVEASTGELQPGETGEFTAELAEDGEYALYCPVGGHRGQGMEGSVVVGEGGAGRGGATTTTEDSGGDYRYP